MGGSGHEGRPGMDVGFGDINEDDIRARLEPESSWRHLPAMMRSRQTTGRAFLTPDAERILYAYYYALPPGVEPEDPDDLSTIAKHMVIKAKAWFGPRTEGPPAHVHGGAQAAFMDQTMGFTAGMYSGAPCVVAKLTVNMRKSLPLCSLCTISCRVARVEESESCPGKKKIFVESQMHLGEKLVADGEILALPMPDNVLEIFMKQYEKEMTSKM